MHKRRNNSRLSKKWSKLKREGRDTLVSGLGFVPGLGTALNIHHTAVKTMRTVRAGKEYSQILSDEIRRRLGRYQGL